MKKADNFNPSKWLIENKITTQSSLKENDILNNTYEVNDEAYQRMEDLVNQKDLSNFISSASSIMKTLSDDGFETKDIFYYLYTRLISNV